MAILEKIRQIVKDGKTLSFYSKEQQDDLLYDINIVNVSKSTLSVNKIEQFSSSHNFRYEDSGLRVWKCYGIGNGKQIPYDEIYIKHQGPAMLQTTGSQGFYDHPDKREIKRRSEASKKTERATPLFECSVHEGCVDALRNWSCT